MDDEIDAMYRTGTETVVQNALNNGYSTEDILDELSNEVHI